MKQFCETVNTNYDKIYALVLNAGAGFMSYQTTKDGLEMVHGVNHIAHFLLVKNLFPLIEVTPKTPIYSTFSRVHTFLTAEIKLQSSHRFFFASQESQVGLSLHEQRKIREKTRLRKLQVP